MRRPAADGVPHVNGGWGLREAAGDAALTALMTRRDLPSAFQRWELVLSPGAQRPTSADDWAGTLTLVRHGSLEVHCHAGGRHRFEAGDVLVLGWLPLLQLRNPGPRTLRLVALRRRDERTPGGALRVIRDVSS
jgi:hypothetical protein